MYRISRNSFLQTFYLLELNVISLQNIFADIAGDPQLFWGDQDKSDVFVTYQCFNKRVYSTSEFQIPTQTDGKVVKTSMKGTNGKQVS